MARDAWRLRAWRPTLSIGTVSLCDMPTLMQKSGFAPSASERSRYSWNPTPFVDQYFQMFHCVRRFHLSPIVVFQR